MIRFIGCCIFLGCYLILGLPVLGIEWIISKFNKELSDRHCMHIVQWGFGCMLAISGVDVTVIGEENIPDGAVLFVGNHRSFFDIPLTHVHCKSLTGYISKKEMYKFPVLRDWMKRIYCLFLDRDNPREGLKTILQAIEYVKQGISVFIFPEGTRNKGEELTVLPFHAGSFKIAEKSGCPIIPVSLNNTSAIFEDHFPRIKKTHVILEYGAPIDMKSMDREEKKHIAEYCQTIIEETIQKNQALV